MLKNNSKHENRVQAKLTAGSQFGTDCGLERWQRTRRGADPHGDGHRVGPEPGSLRVRRDPEDLGAFLFFWITCGMEAAKLPPRRTVRGAVPPKIGGVCAGLLLALLLACARRVPEG